MTERHKIFLGLNHKAYISFACKQYRNVCCLLVFL